LAFCGFGGGLGLGWNLIEGLGWDLLFLLAGFYFMVVDSI
jgi:hypothetical protein